MYWRGTLYRIRIDDGLKFIEFNLPNPGVFKSFRYFKPGLENTPWIANLFHETKLELILGLSCDQIFELILGLFFDQIFELAL